MQIRFFIDGRPQAKARARVVVQGGKVHAFTPKSTVEYENIVRAAYMAEVIRDGTERMRSGRTEDVWSKNARPIHADLNVFFKRPKSHYSKDGMLKLSCRFDAEATIKPDLDNVVKAVLDALKGIAYHDDKQVVGLYANKYYGNREGVEVRLVTIEHEGFID